MPALRLSQLGGSRGRGGGAGGPIDGGMPTEALVVHMIVSKFCDSLPLYRQSQMLARQGIALDRSTLSNWVGSACWWLTPLYELVVATVLSSAKIFVDDTTLPVLDPAAREHSRRLSPSTLIGEKTRRLSRKSRISRLPAWSGS